MGGAAMRPKSGLIAQSDLAAIACLRAGVAAVLKSKGMQPAA
jgi:hypothetical protein